MTGREQILKLANAYALAVGKPLTTISWRLFQDTNKLDAIAAGGDLFLGRYERAMSFFSDSWPAHVDWPADVPRPVTTPVPPVTPARAGSEPARAP